MSLFNERATAEAAAFFLHRAGGRLPVLKLMKLLYLAERLCLQRHGIVLTGDCLVSMPHGPVLSMTLDYINGVTQSSPGGWDTWVSSRDNHMLELADPSMIREPEQDLSHLSESDLAVLGDIWDQFGHMDQWRLRKYTHDHLPEWQDPQGSVLPIHYLDLFKVLGYSEEDATFLTEQLEAQRFIAASFASCH